MEAADLLDYEDVVVDLEMSDEEEIDDREMKFIAVPLNEDALLADQDGDNGDITDLTVDSSENALILDETAGASATATDSNPSNGNPPQPFWIDTKREKIPKTQREQGANYNNDNARANNQAIPSACAATFQSKPGFSGVRNEKRGLVEYSDLDMGANVIPPENMGIGGEPEKAVKTSHLKDLYDSPMNDRRKFHVDPRELSLDEYIRQKERDRRNRGETSIFKPNRRFSNSFGGARHDGGGRAQQYVEQNQEKLRQGLRAIVEEGAQAGPFQGDEGETETSEEPSASPPKWTQDPWNCIAFLTNRGYNISWACAKLKDDENVPEELAERLYKCVVSYNTLIGTCEASHMKAAKQGAAADFLKRFLEYFPTQGGRYSYPTEIDETLTIHPSIVQTLIDKLKENFPDAQLEVRFRSSVDRKSNGVIVHKCAIRVGSEEYEASSNLGQKSAKLKVTKKAYEDLLGQPAPQTKIFRGVECTTPDSLYRGVESETTHCYDLGRVTMLESGNLRQSMDRNNQGRGMGHPRIGRRVMVSYVQPEK